MVAQSQSIPQIFISHSSKDNGFAFQLADDMRKAIGNDNAVWIDKHGGLGVGDDWLDKIIEQITKRAIFIVILSSAAVEADWVKYEINLAWTQRLESSKIILPIRYNVDTFEAPLDLSGIQEIDFRSPRSYQEALTELLARCQKPLPVPVRTPIQSRRAFIAITASTISVMALGSFGIWEFLQKRSSYTQLFSLFGSSYQTPLSSAKTSNIATDVAPPPSAFPATPLLYRADWSRGMDGWNALDWSGDLVCTPNTAQKGLLFCDWNNLADPGLGSGSSIFASFSPTTANYAVEVEIQVVEALARTAVSFGILVRWLLNPLGTVGGYVAGIGGLSILKTPFFEVVGQNQDATKKAEGNAANGYTPGNRWHRYRVEANDTTITLYIDNQKIFAQANSVFREAGTVGLLCSGCRLNVRNFEVIKL